MSRIGRMPIDVPAGVTIDVKEDNVVTVKGPKGTLTSQFDKDMKISKEGEQFIVSRPTEQKRHKALHGLTRTLVNNMVLGVSEGFEKALSVQGVGYRAQKQGKKLILTLGYSHPVEMEEPEGIEYDVPNPNSIIVKGIDKQLVGEFAANIRATRKPEPYLGKGIRYAGEYVRRKAGKSAK